MSSIGAFSDWSHIEQLRKHLWCDREFGKAAVMVGAGFSLNAKRRSPKTPPFPLWHELAGRMYDSLYPPKNPTEQSREKERLKATSGGGVLKLASEYEASFCRQVLDEFIKESIPDVSYSPSELHELLLSLPWSDVFTTNYDTLLERTLPAIHDQKYDLVLTPADIPGKMKPRLVKLHGSFPSHRPFIITEEDYRTYPAKFAPFVNMVQQSIMENVFCLIGFSGDDPNFLRWVGWVRDNLGTNTKCIYLCGILNLSPPQRRVLEDRGVVPIDLSPLFPESNWPDKDQRHAKALEWFLLNLMYGAPPESINWPIPSGESIWKPSDDLPDLLYDSPSLSDPGESEPAKRFLQAEDIEKLCRTWRKTRLEYPGWVVAPMGNRAGLWRYTERWIEPVLQSVKELSPPEDLFLLYELNWRLETSLIPLFMDWVEKITPIIETFNPYPHLVKIEGATIKPDEDEYKQWDWKFIGKCWVKLVFALARKAREDQDKKRFRFWMGRLDKVVKQDIEWQARWFYEECLFYLFRFDQEKIREIMEDWPEASDLPFWEAKRASILAELGELKEAEKIAENALFEIRSRLQPYSIDYPLFSQEGWVMLLLNAITNFEGEHRDRWAKLEAYRCDPWPEIRTLGLTLTRPRPDPRPEKEIKKGFHPGTWTITHSRQFGWNFSKFLPAFAFLRMLEEGAVPTKCGTLSMFSDAALNSAEWIESFAPRWSFSSMVRSSPTVKVGEKEGIMEWFDRVRVATFPQDEINHLDQICTNALRQAIRHLEENPQQINEPKMRFSEDQVKLQSELLSRLCFRFSTKQLDQLFELALNMYKWHISRDNYPLHHCVDLLFQGLLYAMPQSEILEKIPELLSLPIPGEMGFEISDPREWSEPFNHIKWEDTELDIKFDHPAWSAPIAKLIRVVTDWRDYEARKRAVIRLKRIYEIGGLTPDECKDFGEALWSKINEDTDLLPSVTGFYGFAFLDLPETEAGIAKKRFRAYLLSTDIPRVVKRPTTPDGKESKSTSININSPENPLIREWLGGTVPVFPQNEEEKQRFVDWTAEEVTPLLKRVFAWWNDEKGELKDEFIAERHSIADTVRVQFSGLVALMADVILPRLASADEETKALAKSLLSEMEQSGFCVLYALPMTLFIDPTSDKEIAQKLRDGLNSLKEGEVRSSAFGIFRWLVHGSRQPRSTPPPDLLNELVNRVVTRRQPGLDSAIQCVSDIIRILPELLNGSQIESLYIALEYLIKDTELPEIQDREAMSRVRLTIPITDRPEYRKLAAELAYRLFSHVTLADKEVPVLIEWKKICQDDHLPEVRRVWERERSEIKKG